MAAAPGVGGGGDDGSAGVAINSSDDRGGGEGNINQGRSWSQTVNSSAGDSFPDYVAAALKRLQLPRQPQLDSAALQGYVARHAARRQQIAVFCEPAVSILESVHTD